MTFRFASNPANRCRTLGLVLGIGAALPISLAARPRGHPRRPAEIGNEAAYKGAVVTDAATGRILFEDRADEMSPPASMTKLMTYAVLWDKLSSGQIRLDSPVRIEASDARIGGTQVFLDPRETFPVEDLVYAMMIQSANDAAHALARFSAGSVPAFVELMNAKARRLGMSRTVFRTPHGLPPSDRRLSDSDLTTPRDYAILCRYLLLHTDILKYTSVRERLFGVERAHGPIRMVNHNKLLGHVNGVDGLKTGFTDRAAYCIAVTAQRGEHRIIVVVMGSLGPGGRHDFGRLRDKKAIELLERGFADLAPGTSNFPAERAKFARPPVIAVGSNSPSAPFLPQETSVLPVPKASRVPATAPDPTIKLALPIVRP